VTEPRRVRVVHPRTDAAARGPARSAVPADDAATEADEIYVRSLIRGQARIALLVGVTTGVLLGGLAVLGAFWPAADRTRIAGLPVPWLVLGLGIYPVLLALGWLAVREAERNEDEFRTLARRR
jgi:fatty acid desaturase